MTAKIIDGNAIARQVRSEWKHRVEALKRRGVVPGLAVIVVGENNASHVYVRHKTRACEEIGIYSISISIRH
jgi:methylenetetrahydrofolate dehydrogenase (NADP+)/methenyltetrahydrofolate cyclohydrolase